MEWLEQQVIATAPVICWLRLWNRYVDDVMEIVRNGCHQQLTDDKNIIDTTGNIKVRFEEETGGYCISWTVA